MSKRILIPILLLMMVLAGCAGSNNSQTASQVTASTSTPLPATQPAAPQPTQPPIITPTTSVTQTTASSNETPSGCTVVSPKPTPGPTQQSLIPPVSEKDWVQGYPTATVTIIEYSDFQCPYCSRLSPILDVVVQKNPDIRLVFRHLPLIGTPDQPFHDKAALSAQAAEAAGRQGKFWEMHNTLFKEQADWSTKSPADFKTWVVERAATLGLDKGKFISDMTSKEIVDFVQAAWDHAASVNMLSTPTVLINDQLWPTDLPMSYETIVNMAQTVSSLEQLKQRQFSTCPPMNIDRNKQYVAVLHTEKGDITIELLADKAPLAVNNFVFLSRQGWFNKVTFHRVLPDFVAQAGDPTGTGFGGPGYAFVNETSSDLKFDGAGLVAMANAGPDTNGSQFFITFAPAHNLDGQYSIFGRVISGMEVAKKLTPRDPSQNPNLPPGDKILSVDIQEK